MHQPHMAMRPVVPDSTYGRRRTNSIVPAVPSMVNILTHHYNNPHTPTVPTYPIHQPPPPPPAHTVQHLEPAEARIFFKPPLPWYSAPGRPFPRRHRRRRKQPPPPPPQTQSTATTSPLETATPLTTNPPSETDSAHPTTPPSTAPPSTATSFVTRPSVPLTLPAVPVILPKARVAKAPKDKERRQSTSTTDGTAPATPTTAQSEATHILSYASLEGERVLETPAAPTLPPAPVKPTTWADLLKSENAKTDPAVPAAVKANRPANGMYGTLEEALKAFKIHGEVTPPPFLEPRGLVNTGNMCFMNAILQTLVFCGPFYYFLDRVSISAKSFKDDTPLIEAMIMFMREFRVITKDSKSKIRNDEFEALGEPFAPEFFYETIRKLKRFSHMRRGHQQDAEEFLGFLLDGLHEEAVGVMKKVGPSVASHTNGTSKGEEAGWLEVGHKQKAAAARTVEIAESPITKIFGGTLRSVFSVPGLRQSVTREPYTPLQLDIQAPEVKSVIDALKHLTISEKIHGDFKSPNGPAVSATKQVFIETLPPVLILHMKRFQYDNKGGTQKIWKKIAYPRELEIPREAMSTAVKRPIPPKYRLIGVVYHHGSSAQGGHYTVDVLRQDAKSWIRFDDTSIQRVNSKDVAVDVNDIGKYNDFDGEEHDGWVNNWEQVNGSGSTGNGQSKGEGKRYVGKDSKVAYILFYQKI